MTSDNGRILGPDNTPTTTVASGVWGLDELYEARLGNIWPGQPVPPTFAMELVEPSSIAFSGTSAAIVGGGSVTFTAVSSLSLNNVFSSTYDNYMVVTRNVASGNNALQLRLRVGGTDDSTSNSYVNQFIVADGTVVSASRTTATQGVLGTLSSSQRSGQTVFFYGPALAQPTAFRNVDASGVNNAYLLDRANTHNQSVSYDGLTFIPNPTLNFTGRVAVYGLRG